MPAKTDPRLGPCHPAQERGEACKAFQVDDRVNAKPVDPPNSGQRTDKKPEGGANTDGQHMIMGDDGEDVNRNPVLLKNEEKNIRIWISSLCVTHRGIGDDRTSHFGQFHEKHLFRNRRGIRLLDEQGDEFMPQ